MHDLGIIELEWQKVLGLLLHLVLCLVWYLDLLVSSYSSLSSKYLKRGNGENKLSRSKIKIVIQKKKQNKMKIK